MEKEVLHDCTHYLESKKKVGLIETESRTVVKRGRGEWGGKIEKGSSMGPKL